MSNKIFQRADILLPKNADLKKWSVIACDQYTSNPKYWNDLKEFVGDSPSALNMVFPELYLEIETEAQQDERIKNINQTMSRYLENELTEYKNSFIYVERTLKNKTLRRGIVGIINLEAYNYNKGSDSKIRTTEATVIERIPPRVKIRKNAALEIPHIMLLYNDKTDTVNTMIDAEKNNLESVYDFDLYADSGSLHGYLCNGSLADAIENYFAAVNDDIIFAVGDGNHSLATAKNCNSQFALVEIVNIYDESLIFEPIYRVVFDVDTAHLLNEIKKISNSDSNLKVCYNGKTEIMGIDTAGMLTVSALQKFLDNYIKKYGGRIDYIHGEEEAESLSSNGNAAAFLFETIQKSELFDYVSKYGSLERKTFSMGEAYDKRFYLECRQIII